MPIVLNTNSAATEATFNLSKANDSLRRTIARLSSGNRITKPTDDAGGLAVAYKLQSSVKRTEAALNNHQNALSYLQVQDGVLEAIGDIVDRMAELRTMAADVSKNAADVENYSKEFLELQDQLQQMKREKFNGVELFAAEDETFQGMNLAHLITTENTPYEYFDNPDQTQRNNALYDKYEFQLYTHPSGKEEDGNIKLNIVNLQFMLALKNSSGVDGALAAPAVAGLAVASSVNLAGIDQPTTTGMNSSGYIEDITDVSIEEFTNIIEKIADVRAENGAEQQRVNQSLNLHQNNLVNLEAAHGRIMDVDVALESSRLARNSVKVQASAAMVAQANQMSSVALSLLQ
jgi:flagellin-like hook-associated protein FlgL